MNQVYDIESYTNTLHVYPYLWISRSHLKKTSHEYSCQHVIDDVYLDLFWAVRKRKGEAHSSSGQDNQGIQMTAGQSLGNFSSRSLTSLTSCSVCTICERDVLGKGRAVKEIDTNTKYNLTGSFVKGITLIKCSTKINANFLGICESEVSSQHILLPA